MDGHCHCLSSSRLSSGAKNGKGLKSIFSIKSKTTNIVKAMSNSDLTTLLSYLVARLNMYKRVETHWVAALPAIYLCTFT